MDENTYDWDFDCIVVNYARKIAQEKGWKEWDYKYDNKYLTVYGNVLFQSVGIPLSKLTTK